LVEPLAVAVYVTRLAEIKLGQDIVIFGARTIRRLSAAVARCMGANLIISVDFNESRLKLAEKFAATGTFQPQKGYSAEETAQSIKDNFSLPDGVSAVIEATGAEPCVDAGIHVLDFGGKFVQAGLGKIRVQFPIVALSEKEIHMKGSFRYSAGDYDLAMHLLECGKVSVKELITGVEPFERATDAWEGTKRGDGIKTLIREVQN
jgi:D-xylulose reductase